MDAAYTELDNHISFLTEEIRSHEATVAYMEKYMMDESPLVPQDIASLKAELAEMVEELKAATEYAESLP